MATKFFLKALCQPVGVPWAKNAKSGGASPLEESNLFGVIQNLETLELFTLVKNTALHQDVFNLLGYIGDFLKEHSGGDSTQKTIIFYEDNQPLCCGINGIKNKKSKNYRTSVELRTLADTHHITLKAEHITKTSEFNLEYEEFKNQTGLTFNRIFNLVAPSSTPKLR